MRVPRIAVGVFVFAAARLAYAQPVSKPALAAPPSSPKHVLHRGQGPEFGTTTTLWQTIGAIDFDRDDDTTTFTSTWCPDPGCFPFPSYDYRRYVTGGYPHLLAAPRLPGGALLKSIEYDYCDTNAVNEDLVIRVWDCDFLGTCNPTPLVSHTTHGSDGCTGAVDDDVFSYTVDNANKRILIEVLFGATDGTNLLTGVSLGYTLQVSPAPGSATFNDVPTGHPFFQYIEALANSGITGGCGSGNYCPDNPVTRGQMAVFLAKALGLNWAQ